MSAPGIRRLGSGLVLLALVAGAAIARDAAGEGAGPGPRAGDLEAVAPPRGTPVEQERDLGRGPRPPEPVFIEPMATAGEHTRLGLSAWIATPAPFDHRENPGAPALGLSITWPFGRGEAASARPAEPWRASLSP